LLHTCKLHVLKRCPLQELGICKQKQTSIRIEHFLQNLLGQKKTLTFVGLFFIHVINDFCPERVMFLQSLENGGRQFVLILLCFGNLVVPEFESFFVCSAKILRKIKVSVHSA
jgi:hypothetical protein